jgi:hypothetical protein
MDKDKTFGTYYEVCEIDSKLILRTYKNRDSTLNENKVSSAKAVSKSTHKKNKAPKGVHKLARKILSTIFGILSPFIIIFQALTLVTLLILLIISLMSGQSIISYIIIAAVMPIVYLFSFK